MLLPIRASSVHLSPNDAKVLDDEFFMSRPLAHFSARIASLLEANRSSRPMTVENEPEFFAALGLDGVEAGLKFESSDRRLQVATDAVGLRHSAAEALHRFIYARVAAEPKGQDAQSTWLAIADSPTAMSDVIPAAVDALSDDAGRFLRLFAPPHLHDSKGISEAVGHAIDWVNHAAMILLGDQLSVNAANNKLKHGLAVSVRDDVRIELITSPPDDLGNVPLSAFGEGKSVPIFDRPMLTVLNRGKHLRPKQGLETVSLRVDVPVVLAEAWMITNVYAAMFHTAACEHFGDNLPEGLAPYPTLAVGRPPASVIGARPLGYRSAVTLPPDGVSQPRQSGLFFHDRFMGLHVDPDSKISGMVVEG